MSWTSRFHGVQNNVYIHSWRAICFQLGSLVAKPWLLFSSRLPVKGVYIWRSFCSKSYPATGVGTIAPCPSTDNNRSTKLGTGMYVFQTWCVCERATFTKQFVLCDLLARNFGHVTANPLDTILLDMRDGRRRDFPRWCDAPRQVLSLNWTSRRQEVHSENRRTGWCYWSRGQTQHLSTVWRPRHTLTPCHCSWCHNPVESWFCDHFFTTCSCRVRPDSLDNVHFEL